MRMIKFVRLASLAILLNFTCSFFAGGKTLTPKQTKDIANAMANNAKNNKTYDLDKTLKKFGITRTEDVNTAKATLLKATLKTPVGKKLNSAQKNRLKKLTKKKLKPVITPKKQKATAKTRSTKNIPSKNQKAPKSTSQKTPPPVTEKPAQTELPPPLPPRPAKAERPLPPIPTEESAAHPEESQSDLEQALRAGKEKLRKTKKVENIEKKEPDKKHKKEFDSDALNKQIKVVEKKQTKRQGASEEEWEKEAAEFKSKETKKTVEPEKTVPTAQIKTHPQPPTSKNLTPEEEAALARKEAAKQAEIQNRLKRIRQATNPEEDESSDTDEWSD